MTQVHVKVAGAKAEAVKTGQLTRGMVGVPVTFEFGEVWNDLTKTVVYRAGSRVLDDVGIVDTSVVPWELLTEDADLYIGLYGVNSEGTVVIPTTWAHVGTILPAADPSMDVSADPQLPVWASIREDVNKLKQQGFGDVTETINKALAQAKESGEFNGEQGPAGKDYVLTDADIDNIAELAMQKISSAEGVSF